MASIKFYSEEVLRIEGDGGPAYSPCHCPVCESDFEYISVRWRNGKYWDDTSAYRAFDETDKDVTNTEPGQWAIEMCIARTENYVADFKKEQEWSGN